MARQNNKSLLVAKQKLEQDFANLQASIAQGAKAQAIAKLQETRRRLPELALNSPADAKAALANADLFPPEARDLSWRVLGAIADKRDFRTLKAHSVGPYLSVSFVDKGKALASVGSDKTYRVWDVANSKELAKQSGFAVDWRAVALSPNGTIIATASGDGTVRLWSAGSGDMSGSFKLTKTDTAALTFGDDDTLATGHIDGTAYVWEAASGKQIAQIKGHTGGIRSVALVPGKLLATGGSDKLIRLSDPASREEIAIIRGHTDAITALEFSADNKLLVSGSGGTDKTVRVWDVATRELRATSRPFPSPVTSIAIAGQSTIAVALTDGTIRLWELGD